MYSHNAMTPRERLRIIAAFILLFGSTWIFGFLVVSNDIIAFQYIFCVLNSLQGFFVFLFYCVRNQNVRKAWSEKFGIKKLGSGSSAESSSATLRSNKTDSMTFTSPVYEFDRSSTIESQKTSATNNNNDNSVNVCENLPTSFDSPVYQLEQYETLESRIAVKYNALELQEPEYQVLESHEQYQVLESEKYNGYDNALELQKPEQYQALESQKYHRYETLESRKDSTPNDDGNSNTYESLK